MNKYSFERLASIILISFFISISMISCDYEFIEIDLPDPDIPVNFSADILPIFTVNSNCTACHKPGSTSPFLTPEYAYNSIVPGLINSSEPELSKIYLYPNPSTPTHSFRKYTVTQAALILAWIQQGAENN